MRYLFLFSLLLPSYLYAQRCLIDPRDDSTIEHIRPFNLPDNYNYEIDARKLLGEQSLSISCWVRRTAHSSALVWITNFKYEVSRDEEIIAQGLNKGAHYFKRELGEAIINSIVRDSKVFVEYHTSLDSLSNVKILPLSYRIIENSIHKNDANEKKGYKMIWVIQEWIDLRSRYPGYGSSYGFLTSRWPSYSANKEKIYCETTCLHIIT